MARTLARAYHGLNGKATPNESEDNSMQNDTTLLVAAQTATSAAHALAECTKATRRTKRLTVADHADVLDAMRETIAALTGAPGVLRSTLRVLMEQRDFPPMPDGAADDELARSLADLYDTADHARIQACRADIDPARNRLSTDLRRLVAIKAPAAKAMPARNVVATAAREATEQIMLFGGRIHPDDAPLDHVLSALENAADVTLSLKAACLHEARLVENAYHDVALGRSSVIVTETITAAGQALGTAHRTLTTAADSARILAKREQRILAAA